MVTGVEDLRRDAEEVAAHFPALLVEAERVAHTVAAGLHGRRRAGPGENFWQHRAYAFGDPVSTIDWRQSARAADRLFVRQNEWEAAAAVWLWRDPSQSLDYASSGGPTKRRRADILAVALSILLAEAGERIGLLGVNARPHYGRIAPMRILEALTSAAIEIPAAPPSADIAFGARVALFSDFFLDPVALERAVTDYAGAGAQGLLVQIVDPVEEDFPFKGRTDFEDLESPERLLFGDAGSVAAAYRERFKAHRAALRGLAQRFQWSYIAHRIDRPAETALFALFTAMTDLRGAK